MAITLEPDKWMGGSTVKGPMLGKLFNRKVIHILISDDRTKLEISEACDQYFSADLGKTDLAQLVSELQELYSQMR